FLLEAPPVLFSELYTVSRKGNKMLTRFFTPVIIISYLTSMINMANRWWNVAMLFIYNGNTVTSASSFRMVFQAPTWSNGISAGTVQLLILLGDGVMVCCMLFMILLLDSTRFGDVGLSGIETGN